MSKLSQSKRQANPAGELRPFAGLQRLQPHAAGIDIGAHEILICVPGSDNTQLVRTFGNYTADLHTIATWLKEHGIQTVAMESGALVSWKQGKGNSWVPKGE